MVIERYTTSIGALSRRIHEENMRLLTLEKALESWDDILALQTESDWDNNIHTVQASKILLSSCNKKQLKGILRSLCLENRINPNEYCSKNHEFNLEVFKSKYEKLLDLSGFSTQSSTDIIVLGGKSGFLSSRLFKETHTGHTSKKAEVAKVTLTDLPKPTLVILDSDVTKILNSRQQVTAKNSSDGIPALSATVEMEHISEMLEIGKQMLNVLTEIMTLLNDNCSQSRILTTDHSVVIDDGSKEINSTENFHSKRRCFLCRERGHVKRNCTKQRNNKK